MWQTQHQAFCAARPKTFFTEGQSDTCFALCLLQSREGWLDFVCMFWELFGFFTFTCNLGRLQRGAPWRHRHIVSIRYQVSMLFWQGICMSPIWIPQVPRYQGSDIKCSSGSILYYHISSGYSNGINCWCYHWHYQSKKYKRKMSLLDLIHVMCHFNRVLTHNAKEIILPALLIQTLIQSRNFFHHV